MKKRITCGLVLILSSLLAFQPIVALAMSEASTAASNPRSPKLIPPPKPARPARPVRSQTGELTGQTSTLLPDGRLLLAGGQDTNGPKAIIAISDPRTGEVVPLSVVLRQARAWHTATMLPNGRVLIVGGKGLNDTTVESAEILDLASQTVELISSPGFACLSHCDSPHGRTCADRWRPLRCRPGAEQSRTVGLQNQDGDNLDRQTGCRTSEAEGHAPG